MEQTTDRFRLYSFDEMTSMPPPSREQEYRRGYRDGWRYAADAIAAAVLENNVPFDDAYDRARKHGLYALLEWMRSTDPEYFIAPSMDTKKDVV